MPKRGRDDMVMLHTERGDIWASIESKLAFCDLKPDDVRVEFTIEGISFITTERILDANPHTFFTVKHRNDKKDNYELTGEPFDSAYMFPVIFDYMDRLRTDEDARLRTREMGWTSTEMLDKIEDFIFPGTRSFVPDPKNPRHALIALPDIDDANTISFDADMAIDVEFIQYVVDMKADPKKKLSDEDKAKFEKRFSCNGKLSTQIIRRFKLHSVDRSEKFKVVIEWGHDSRREINVRYDCGAIYLDESIWIIF